MLKLSNGQKWQLGKNIATEYTELAVESFNEFLSNGYSTYIKEETEVIDDSYSESKESTKTNVKVNEVKLLNQVF